MPPLKALRRIRRVSFQNPVHADSKPRPKKLTSWPGFIHRPHGKSLTRLWGASCWPQFGGNPHETPYLKTVSYRQLGDAWVAGLARPEGAERRIVVEFVEAADLICTVYGSRADALRSEVGMIQNIEVLPAELNPQAFCHDEILGKLYVPVRGLGQAIRVLADVAKGAEDGWIIGSTRRLGGLKSTWVQPLPGCGDAGAQLLP